MANISFFFLSLILLILLSGCDSLLDYKKELNNKYTIEELNYFYEVAFHSEVRSNQAERLSKWGEDILLYMEGDTLEGDMEGVRNAINEINRLQLPLKLKLTDDKTMANLHVFFGNQHQLGLEENVWGEGIFTEINGVINQAEVKILTVPSVTTRGNGRNNIILEEITQILGIRGDSFAYPLSVFYEYTNYTAHLEEIDKRMLQLLYEPALPAGLTVKKFEEDFSEQLYHVNKEGKLLRYVKEYSIKKETLKQILQFGLVEKGNSNFRIVKFNQPVFITISGDTTAIHRLWLQEAIKKVEQTCENIKLKLVPTDSVYHDGGIRYHFSKENHQSHGVAVKVSVTVTNDLLFDKRVSSKINIDYKNSAALDQKMPRAIANALYQSICLVNQNAPEFWEYKNNVLMIKPEYREALKLYYSTSLAENMTKEELERVLDQME